MSDYGGHDCCRGKTSEITSYLKDVFENRFHVPVDVEIDYEEVKESKYKKFNEMQLQQEVDAIRKGIRSCRHSMLRKRRRKQKKRKAYQRRKRKKQKMPLKKQMHQVRRINRNRRNRDSEKAGICRKVQWVQKWQGSFVRRDYPLKRSDDPNVIYGRDFDDMPIELEDSYRRDG